MPNQSPREAKWLHNRQFVAQIPDDYADWIVTAMFYTALHAVEVLFAHDHTRAHANHTERNQTLKRIRRYEKIWLNYRPLLDASRTARYDVNAPSSWLPVADVKSHLAQKLYNVERSVLKLTGASRESLDPIWKPPSQ